MTQDELVQFAADKLGMVPCDNWQRFNSDLMMKSDETCGHQHCVPREFFPPVLTSSDLFIKGLEACPYYVSIHKHDLTYGYYVAMLTKHGRGAKRAYTNISDIPYTFWACWAEVDRK